MFIDTFERINTRTHVTSYMLEVSDDHDDTILIFAGDNFPKHPKSNVEIFPSDSVELINLLTKERHAEHGSSCEVIADILERARENLNGVWIGGEHFDGHLIKEALEHDWRNLYKCPECGWESWDDDAVMCGRGTHDIEMEFVKQEHYSLV